MSKITVPHCSKISNTKFGIYESSRSQCDFEFFMILNNFFQNNGFKTKYFRYLFENIIKELLKKI